jgi:hypothetical protein
MKTYIWVLIMFCSMTAANSQVLISLLFGDKLNSPFLEFGLEGGVNFSTVSNLGSADPNTGFNLGFYFDIKSKKNPAWMINTGVIVKSPMGAQGLDVYSLNNEELDQTFAGGSVDREIRYFNVPVLIKYQFENHLYVKAGPMAGLLAKAFDKFTREIDGEDVVYKNNIRDKIHVVDAGLLLGVGYHINKANGMNIGLQYYYGLVPLLKGDSSPTQYNRSLYVTVAVPIGKGKAAKEAAERKSRDEIIVTPVGN